MVVKAVYEGGTYHVECRHAHQLGPARRGRAGGADLRAGDQSVRRAAGADYRGAHGPVPAAAVRHPDGAGHPVHAVRAGGRHHVRLQRAPADPGLPVHGQGVFPQHPHLLHGLLPLCQYCARAGGPHCGGHAHRLPAGGRHLRDRCGPHPHQRLLRRRRGSAGAVSGQAGGEDDGGAVQPVFQRGAVRRLLGPLRSAHADLLGAEHHLQRRVHGPGPPPERDGAGAHLHQEGHPGAGAVHPGEPPPGHHPLGGPGRVYRGGHPYPVRVHEQVRD